MIIIVNKKKPLTISKKKLRRLLSSLVQKGEIRLVMPSIANEIIKKSGVLKLVIYVN